MSGPGVVISRDGSPGASTKARTSLDPASGMETTAVSREVTTNPSGAVARLWAVVETVTGVLYLAILMARLVSLYRK